MFQAILQWDGVFDHDNRYDSTAFHAHLDVFKSQIGISTEKFNWHETVGLTARHNFVDFKKAWDHFRSCKFKFINIDIIKENNRFIETIDSLRPLGKFSQFLKLDISYQDTPEYKEAIDNILHRVWLKNIKEYLTVVELSDKDNNPIEDYAGKFYSERNPSFCILPWMHIQYKPTGQSKLCCRYDIGHETSKAVLEPNSTDKLLQLSHVREKSSIQTTTMEESFFGDYWNAAREYTDSNTPLVGCHKCYKEERGNKGEVSQSMRLGSAILYNDGLLHKRLKFDKPKLEFLEVGFGNYCNLACLTCNSSLSTTWHNDELELNQSVNKNIKRQVFKKLDNLKFVPDKETLQTLRVIKFTGGEPMINPEFIKFIDLICEQGNPGQVSLEIYTNCSYIPSPKLLENLTKFEAVQLNLSIDAYGQANDYIRYGSIWEGDAKQTVSNAIDHWLAFGKQHENISIIMSTTLSVLSVLEIPKLMTWWMDKFKDSGNKITVFRKGLLANEYDGFFKLQPAHDPSYINLNMLPAEYYNEVLNWADDYRNNYTSKYPELGGIPECIGASLLKLKQTILKAKGNAEEAKNLLNYLSNIDNIRKNSCEDSIPEIVSKVKEYLQALDTQI
jgi:organic radical activating enzyme